jgi:hypothetical protein
MNHTRRESFNSKNIAWRIVVLLSKEAKKPAPEMAKGIAYGRRNSQARSVGGGLSHLNTRNNVAIGLYFCMKVASVPQDEALH